MCNYNNLFDVAMASKASEMISPSGSQSRDKREGESAGWTPPSLGYNRKSNAGDAEGLAHQALGGLWELLDHEGLTDFGSTNARLIKASKVTMCIWAVLTTSVYLFSPSHVFERASSLESQVCTVAFCLLLMSNVSRFLPLFYADSVFANRGMNGTTAQLSFTKMGESGFLVAAFTVQFIAMVACGLMAFFPTPILIDPISHTRVYLVRWCEWAPLGFLLTFLSEEIDVPTPANRRMSLLHSIVQGVAVTAGFMFPFVSNPKLWWTIVAIACAMFSSLFVRVWQKQQRLEALRQEELARPLLRTGRVCEAYERCRLSHRSLVECAVVWTLLVVLHFAAAFLPHFMDTKQYFNMDPLALPMIAETFCEVLSKHLHILVVESVFQSFSTGSRSRRVLDQLRRVMSAFWERASDALVLSLRTKNNHRICLASPTFLAFMGLENENQSMALVFELVDEDDDHHHHHGTPPQEQTSTSTSPLLPAQRAYIVNLEELKAGDMWASNRSVTLLPPDKWRYVESISSLILSNSNNESGVANHHHQVHSFQRPDGNNIHCEAIATNMEGGSTLLVLRDISDRIRRFEAEKKLAVETTEREKDSQTNRFTRHEVKNGLLAGIYLCDTMKENLKAKACGSCSSGGTGTKHGSNCQDPALTELESTLHEVLDTVLSEAMSRDVIHEAYMPREEAVDIAGILGTTRSEVRRFPLEVVPPKLPLFFMDKQLLRYIHRNALSNACKYGKRDGVVQTILQYNEETRLLNIEIINEPGNHHERLMTMGGEATKGVFEPGHQLHKTWDGTDVREASVSSGDGAWIMRKCARIMGGDTTITFNPERTIFRLTIPAKPVAEVKVGDGDCSTFAIPQNTWGIVVDDSKVQRKLLGRFLSLIGIQPERQVILGATVEEVHKFHSHVKELMQEHQECKFFVIADENLDFTDGGINHQNISGSLCVQRLLMSLEPAEEKRLLAVVRSANDSSVDLETYKRRSHGFLPKEPIRKENVMDLIRPLWEARFPQVTSDSMEGTRGNEGVNATGACTIASTSSTDLIQNVEVLDGLIQRLVTNADLEVTLWPQIKEKFLVLQGDMMTLTDHSAPRVSAVIDALKDLRELEVSPVDMRTRWQLIRSLIISLV
ncbi:expressed unknown protein [Seminavis robusta]|uniref:Uncharacterized protein n=1 Tax=Seminavis robusta TaxID=568900 RepID=A0A9N8D689_9STRA|nr:expressed unknown protein [Seminavis robusta]|eukprot:Sro16_g011730.1 n/a (1122) ;mRNA; f:85535-89076